MSLMKMLLDLAENDEYEVLRSKCLKVMLEDEFLGVFDVAVDAGFLVRQDDGYTEITTAGAKLWNIERIHQTRLDSVWTS